MNELKDKINKVKGRWEGLYEFFEKNPQQWKDNYQELAPEDVSKLINTVWSIYNRTKAPKNRSLGFNVAKYTALSMMPQIEKNLSQLENKQYGQISNLVQSLSRLLGASLTLLNIGIDDEERLYIRLSNDSLEKLEQIEENCKISKEYLQSFEDVSERVDAIKNEVNGLEDKKDELENEISEVNKLWDKIENHRKYLEQKVVEIDSIEEELKEQQNQISDLIDVINESKKEIEGIRQYSANIKEKISNILPEATSERLSYAFKERADILFWTKLAWAVAFILSIVGMIFVGKTIDYESSEIWKEALFRTPFWAPLIWIGWFSAVQYGNALRLEEDYRFKASTAIAFVGYKDHMDHLKDIDFTTGESALHHLSKCTVDILSEEPVRFLAKSTYEASPTNNALNILHKKNSFASLSSLLSNR